MLSRDALGRTSPNDFRFTKQDKSAKGLSSWMKRPAMPAEHSAARLTVELLLVNESFFTFSGNPIDLQELFGDVGTLVRFANRALGVYVVSVDLRNVAKPS
ncbi:hypothetical protein T265_09114 [Opisthorchis viverrini]|uniref:Uncharacterized protein n=1 Tax=Opisthorchis viverrini TaxID=6198 RepID=A0A075A611_OPIVI|nr:hypothetical protein T265_09114 [Opisthorchis viverrini]KER22879.1 hypothetical protein T265_09114 [Opisthorchis viverrini]